MDVQGPGRRQNFANGSKPVAAMDDYIQPDLNLNASGGSGVTEALLPWASLGEEEVRQPLAANGPLNPFAPGSAHPFPTEVDTEQGLGSDKQTNSDSAGTLRAVVCLWNGTYACGCANDHSTAELFYTAASHACTS